MKSDEGHPLMTGVRRADNVHPQPWRLSPSFKLDEFTRSTLAARLGIDNEPNEEELENLRSFCLHLAEPLRAEFGPLFVSSGLRVHALNNRIPGSSSSSAHTWGGAFDCKPLDTTVRLASMVEWVRHSDLPFDQVILEYNSWMHLGARRLGDDREPRRQALMKFSGTRYIPFDLSDERVR